MVREAQRHAPSDPSLQGSVQLHRLARSLPLSVCDVVAAGGGRGLAIPAGWCVEGLP